MITNPGQWGVFTFSQLFAMPFQLEAVPDIFYSTEALQQFSKGDHSHVFAFFLSLFILSFSHIPHTKDNHDFCYAIGLCFIYYCI